MVPGVSTSRSQSTSSGARCDGFTSSLGIFLYVRACVCIAEVPGSTLLVGGRAESEAGCGCGASRVAWSPGHLFVWGGFVLGFVVVTGRIILYDYAATT